MNKTIKTLLALVSVVLGTLPAYAQNTAPPNGQPPPDYNGPRRHHRPPPLPLLLALDTNHDGIIDSNEIANASAELLTLDKNGDGQLASDEYLPPRPRKSNSSGRTFRPPPSPLIEALDVNHDGIIDAEEIANAPAELKTLDKNGDGKLTRGEYCPPPPPGMGNDDSDGGPPQGPPADDAPGSGPPVPPPSQ
ncbi:MAG: EF-hand domain-containing protein [Limisphaerales bacterium]